MTRDKIEDVFNIFHDGSIEEEYEFKNNTLLLKISCLYLAELVNKDFEYFYIKLSNLKTFSLKPWHRSLDTKAISNISEILNFQLEIKSCDIENNIFNITCLSNYIEDNGGGNLLIDADTINVYDETKKEITLSSLISISKNYWDKLSSR